MGIKFVRYLGASDESYLGHVGFETVMGHPWKNFFWSSRNMDLAFRIVSERRS